MPIRFVDLERSLSLFSNYTKPMKTHDLTHKISRRAQMLAPSKIRQVAELGMSLDGVIPLWFGEGSWPTSDRINQAAISALQNNDHFYQPNNGRMALRAEIAKYTQRLYNTKTNSARITVTASGMQGLMLTGQALVSSGDKVVLIEPGWPNMAQVCKMLGADIHSISLQSENNRWSLDLDALLAALDNTTKMLVINSPNNPTGWTMSAAEQKIVLDHCRHYGIWIVADDVYARLYQHADVAPSFLAIAEEDDLVISVNSFSKCWSMTGWRLGWIDAPAAMESTFAKLSEFNIACPAGFIQAAGEVALHEGEADIAQLREKLKTAYQTTQSALQSFNRVQFTRPDGAFYCFFKVDGMTDSVVSAQQILQETKVGLAPGLAFGESGEGYLRLCYAQPNDVLLNAFDRLESFLNA